MSLGHKELKTRSAMKHCWHITHKGQADIPSNSKCTYPLTQKFNFRKSSHRDIQMCKMAYFGEYS